MKFFPGGLSTLRGRLLLLFGCSVLVMWAVASGIAYYEMREEIDEILDAQQIVFARYLANSDLRSAGVLPDAQGVLALAVFDAEGRVVLNNGLYGLLDPKNQRAFPLSEAEPKLYDQNRWRVLWLELPEERFGKPCVLAVAQHRAYRGELVREALEEQLVAWLIFIPLLLFAVLWITGREFRPLSEVADALMKRRPEDATPIEERRLPGEVRPFVKALNVLFARVSEMMLRERRFTSDAAHELRSPLAGLGVQVEVARMATDDPDVLEHSLSNLTRGIDRTARLVEQLLALSRLDSLTEVEGAEDIDWPALLRTILDDFSAAASRRNVDLRLENAGAFLSDLSDSSASPAPSAKGHELLLSLLLRNLIDNALSHAPIGHAPTDHAPIGHAPTGHGPVGHGPIRGTVCVSLLENSVCVEDNGPGVLDEYLPRLGERFFRLPGQDRAGTGLGLSIAKRIAELHGFHIVFSNRPGGGFRACLHFVPATKN